MKSGSITLISEIWSPILLSSLNSISESPISVGVSFTLIILKITSSVSEVFTPSDIVIGMIISIGELVIFPSFLPWVLLIVS